MSETLVSLEVSPKSIIHWEKMMENNPEIQEILEQNGAAEVDAGGVPVNSIEQQ